MTIASGIMVHCAHSEIVKASSLRPNPKNPNQHPDIQVQLLAEIILFQGWRVPITVSNRSGFIVRGHCRELVSQYLELDDVPVDYQDYEDEASEMADLLADNQLPELAHMNTDKLKEIILRLDETLSDLSVLGMPQDKIEEMIVDPSTLTTGGGWDEPPCGHTDSFMPFRFGVISGMVSRTVYDEFVKFAEGVRANHGSTDVPLVEVVRGWIDEAN